MFALWEITQILITIVAIGFIFSGFIKKPQTHKDYFEQMFGGNRWSKFLNWGNFKFSTAVVAPAIILHELGHKFAGIALGYPSYYEMSSFGLSLGVFLRLIGSRFLLFLPGYVVIPGATDIHLAAIAFAGPAVNLILLAVSWAMLESGKFRKYSRYLWISKQINLWLFIFNMLPIPPLDGSKVVIGLMAIL
jgi:Zn-dependent protease